MANPFRVRLLGYDRKQVIGSLGDRASQYEEALAAKQERINQLRVQNAALTAEAEHYRRMQADISDALVNARAQAAALKEQATMEARLLCKGLEDQIRVLEQQTLRMFEDQIGQIYEMIARSEAAMEEEAARILKWKEALARVEQAREDFLRSSFQKLAEEQGGGDSQAGSDQVQ